MIQPVASVCLKLINLTSSTLFSYLFSATSCQSSTLHHVSFFPKIFFIVISVLYTGSMNILECHIKFIQFDADIE